MPVDPTHKRFGLIAVTIAVILFCLLPILAFAGTPREKAIAAVAVARARVKLANEKPKLPDTSNRFSAIGPRAESELVVMACDGNTCDQWPAAEIGYGAKGEEQFSDVAVNSRMTEEMAKSCTITISKGSRSWCGTFLSRDDHFTIFRTDGRIESDSEIEQRRLVQERIVKSQANANLAWDQVKALERENAELKAKPTPEKVPESILPTKPVMEQMRFEFPATAAIADGPIEATVYTSKSCIPCRVMHDWCAHGDKRIVLTYIDAVTPVVQKSHNGKTVFVNAGYPCTTWTDASGKERYLEGAHTLDEIVNEVKKDGAANWQTAASGVAGSINAAAYIQQAIDGWREHVGTTLPSGKPVLVTFTWRRTGGQSFPLLHGNPEQWTFANIFGSLGEFEIDAPGSKLPVTPILVGYRRANGQLLLRGEVTISESDVGLPGDKKTQAIAGAQPSGVGVMVLLSIFSVAKDIFALLNPTCDLTLGGTVSATAFYDQSAETIQIDFHDAPAIKLVALWQFDLSVKRLRISTRNVHVDFSGSRLVHSRDFKVN